MPCPVISVLAFVKAAAVAVPIDSTAARTATKIRANMTAYSTAVRRVFLV